MKVKEFIEQLQKLDQEKNIWIIYDTFAVWEPEVETIEEGDQGHGAEVGDYVMFAG